MIESLTLLYNSGCLQIDQTRMQLGRCSTSHVSLLLRFHSPSETDIDSTNRHDVLIRGFLKLGLFVAGGATEDEKVEKIQSSGLSSAFYPHGVGVSSPFSALYIL